MRISDWSSDVCSSDLLLHPDPGHHGTAPGGTDPRGHERVAGAPGARADGDPVPVERRPVGGGREAAAHHAGTAGGEGRGRTRSEEHTSELQSLMRISYAVFCLKKKKSLLRNSTATLP